VEIEAVIQYVRTLARVPRDMARTGGRQSVPD
jgi:hypothetical protein